MSEDKFAVDDNKDKNTNETSDAQSSETEQQIPENNELLMDNKETKADVVKQIMVAESVVNEVEPIADKGESVSDEEESVTDEVKPIIDEVEPVTDEVEPVTDEVEPVTDEVESVPTKKKSKVNIYKIIRIFCIIGFFVFAGLFINEVIIQPYRIKKSIELTRDLYNKPTKAPVTVIPTEIPDVTPLPEKEEQPEVIEATPTPDPNRDAKGRLLQFADLLSINEDVKGWITIPETNVDYVVLQSSNEDPDYYLYKDINEEYSKAGTLYLDYKSSVETETPNLVIHGHNMVSTAEKMFHYLLDYKKVCYYKERPVITFDNIYNTGEWKIFAVFITNGSDDKEPFFNYTKSSFKNSSEFLNFVYQLRIRSVLNIDTVDINENDQLLTLSTCSYEIDNYRTVIVARKVREGEETTVDVDSVTKNTQPLYPQTYYNHYEGEAPELYKTFEEALENGAINWYSPVETQ